MSNIKKDKGYNYKLSDLRERVMKSVFLITACVSIFCVALISIFLFVNAIPTLAEIGPLNFILGQRWKPAQDIYGILPMILGSIYVTAGAIVIGVPIGVFTAIFLAKFCNKTLYKVLSPAVNLLAGIPSIVYGFLGMVILVPFIKNVFGGKGDSILAASILLGIMILPTIVAVSENAIRQVDNSYYDGALALGATHERAVFLVQLRAATSGILASVVLGIGRAIGETMAVVMVAGNQAIMPTSLLKGARTMTSNIVIEMGEAADLHREALIATAVVLFVFILLINLSFSALRIRREKAGL